MSSIPQKQPPARMAVSSVGEQPGFSPAGGRVQVLGSGAAAPALVLMLAAAEALPPA